MTRFIHTVLLSHLSSGYQRRSLQCDGVLRLATTFMTDYLRKSNFWRWMGSRLQMEASRNRVFLWGLRKQDSVVCPRRLVIDNHKGIDCEGTSR